jgi:hypothetical protein
MDNLKLRIALYSFNVLDALGVYADAAVGAKDLFPTAFEDGGDGQGGEGPHEALVHLVAGLDAELDLAFLEKTHPLRRGNGLVVAAQQVEPGARGKEKRREKEKKKKKEKKERRKSSFKVKVK